MKNTIILKRRPAYEIVLSALQEGMGVKLGEIEYIMQDNEIGYVVQCYNSETKETIEKFAVIDISLNYFIRSCSCIKEDDLIIISCETSLTKMKKERRRNFTYDN